MKMGPAADGREITLWPADGSERRPVSALNLSRAVVVPVKAKQAAHSDRPVTKSNKHPTDVRATLGVFRREPCRLRVPVDPGDRDRAQGAVLPDLVVPVSYTHLTLPTS